MSTGYPDYSQSPLNQPRTGEHFSGTLTTSTTTITLQNRSKALFVDNLAWDTIQISFDGATSWLDIAPHTAQTAEVEVLSFSLRAKTGMLGDSASYQGIAWT